MKTLTARLNAQLLRQTPFSPWRWCLVIGSAAMLMACGGGEPTAEPGAAAPLASQPAPATRALAVAAPEPVVPLDAHALFNWAETKYPSLFPGAKPNLALAPYLYRHYPETGNYVGVAGEDVYILGPVSNNVLQRVGALEDFRCQVLPDSCVKPGARSGWRAT
jgi:hypothetical protein